tara:strand:- start:526 stop:678 length:153 start_codon:yes stop_codon:yes gene_type:complete
MTLDPGLTKRRFTDSEDQIVLGLVTKAGGVGNIQHTFQDQDEILKKKMLR